MQTKLHELHQRRLEATVQLIEDGLNRSERLLREGGREGVVRAVENTLTDESRARLLKGIEQLRAALQEFAGRFGLKRHALDIRQVLNAELSSTWVMLENCRPKRMKGYGVTFEEGLRKTLEESVEELLAQVNHLRAMLG